MCALIVDDEKNIRRTLLMALESTGHDAMAVASGPLAIEELKANNYDVILLDLKLSEESGLDVLQEILRVSPRTAGRHGHRVCICGNSRQIKAMRRGAFDYLPKPSTPDQVRQVLAHIERAVGLAGQLEPPGIAQVKRQPRIGVMEARVANLSWLCELFTPPSYHLPFQASLIPLPSDERHRRRSRRWHA